MREMGQVYIYTMTVHVYLCSCIIEPVDSIRRDERYSTYNYLLFLQ